MASRDLIIDWQKNGSSNLVIQDILTNKVVVVNSIEQYKGGITGPHLRVSYTFQNLNCIAIQSIGD